MDQVRYTQAKTTSSASNPVPQLSSIGNTQFVDFSYPAPLRTNNDNIEGTDETQMSHSDPYGHLGRASTLEHQYATASISGWPSLSSNGLSFQIQVENLRSPQKNRDLAIAMDDEYVDDFRLNQSVTGNGGDSGNKMKEKGIDPAPPWGELRTKAGKERKRLPLACIACRRKKIRCSGEKPACKHCLKSRIPCVYKITTRKAAPRTDYMAMLDRRLKRIEERIMKIVPKEVQDPTLVTRAQVKPIIAGTAPGRNVGGKKRLAEDAFGAELAALAAKPDSRNNNEEQELGSLHMQGVEEGALLAEGAAALPSQDIQEHLAEVYFGNLSGQSYHLLH